MEKFDQGIDFGRWYRELRRKFLEANQIYEDMIDAVAGTGLESIKDSRLNFLFERLALLKKMLEVTSSLDRPASYRMGDLAMMYTTFNDYSRDLQPVFRHYCLRSS